MTHTHPEALDYAEHQDELVAAADTTPAKCVDDDHDYELIDDSFGHEFGTEIIVYRRCKVCGHETEAPEICDGDYE